MMDHSPTYFESREYREICEEEGYTRKTEMEVNFILKMIEKYKVPSPQNVLDLGCGYGRHSLLLVQKGLDVTGVDLSEALIREAVRRSKNGEGVNPTFMVMDMRRIGIREQFSYAISLFFTFGIFERKINSEILKRTGEKLRLGGLLIVDLWNIFTFLLYLVEKGAESKRQVGQSLEVTELYNLNPQTLFLEWEEKHCKGGITSHYGGFYQFYVIPMLEEDLLEANMEIVEIKGSFDGDPYSVNSERMIVVARKF